jgi:hypothetical protein
LDNSSADQAVALQSSAGHFQDSARIDGEKLTPAIDGVAGAQSFDRIAANWPASQDKAQPKKRITLLKDRVSVVKTLQGLRKIGELRYAMYVEKDKKAYAAADSSHRCFLELVDMNSLNLVALRGSECLGGIRLTKAADGLDDEYLMRLLSHAPFDPSQYNKVVICSRLVLANTLRARFQMPSLLRKALRISLKNGADYGLMCTRPALVPLFTKMGWVQHGESYHEEIVGDLVVLVLDLRSSTARSIFLRVYDALKHRKKPQVGV